VAMRGGVFGPGDLGRRLRVMFFAARGRAVQAAALDADQTSGSGGTGRHGGPGRNDEVTDTARNGRSDLSGPAGRVDWRAGTVRSGRGARAAQAARTVRKRRLPFSGSNLLARSLPSLLILGGILFEFFAPARFTGSPFFAAAPLVAAPLFSMRTTLVTGITALTVALGAHLASGDATYIQSIVELITVMTVAALALLINGVVRRGDVQLASARGIAEATQRAVLPTPSSRIGGLEIAARYEAAHAEASIGGDLYAVQDTPYGVRLIVGDVRGKGLEAVEVVAVLIGAFREAAEQETALEGVATRLERALRRDGEWRQDLERFEGFATAVLAEVPWARPAAPQSFPAGTIGVEATGAEIRAEAGATRTHTRTQDLTATGDTLGVPGGRTPAEVPLRKGPRRERSWEGGLQTGGASPAGVVRVLNRGHPAPLILYADGNVRRAEPDVPALPLGMGDLGIWPDRVEEFPFPESALLLLFTDGVTEARDPSGAFYEPEDRLRGWSFSKPDGLLDALVADVSRHTRERANDDMALLAVMRPPASGNRE
jgi:hypothetical protein